ncbi:MAG: hypothetical protein KDD62_05440 [Bdellovibrionales bacterium]|nr:hypothetical protein [Bdellovibrionales bacterium]
MKHLASFTVIMACALFITACNGAKTETTNSDIQNEATEQNHTNSAQIQDTNGKVSLAVDGVNYVIDNVDAESSFLMFYSEGSSMGHDANLELVSGNNDKRLSVIIDGLQGKGKESLTGEVRFEETSSLVSFKEGELQINFTEGLLRIEEVSKKSGSVKLKASGKCTVKKGSSFKDMKVDVPAQLVMEATFANVKTSDFKK